MPRITVFVLILSAAAGCSREPVQQTPATSQAPPTASPADPEPAPPSPQQDAATPPAAPNDQRAAEASKPAPSDAPSPAAGAAPAASAPAAVAPPAPPAPRFREITVPAGTFLSVTLETPVASDTSQVEDVVEGRLAKSIVISRTAVLPAGSRITGSVLGAQRSGRVKGRASVVIRFNRITAHGESYSMQTARITREAEASTKSDVKKGGIGAGVGAVIGGIAGGGKGAAIGGVVGGAGTVMATRGKEVRLEPGTTITARLTSPLDVRVEVSDAKADRDRTNEP